MVSPVVLRTELATAIAAARLPGTCGEWIQGTLDGTPCLVSCAIDWYAQTTVEIGGAHGAWSLPAFATKACRALFSALEARGNPPVGGVLRLANPLPRGRGYASSTADVAGTILATGAALGRPFSPTEVAALAATIEPSDGIMFPRPGIFAHQDGRLWCSLDPLPPLTVVVLDPGGEVDTVSFNGTDHRALLRHLAPWHRDIFADFKAATANGDALGLARAATQSALAHQHILPSDLVDRAYAMFRALGALGICRAHSGTLVGLICEPGTERAVATAAAARLRGLSVQPYRCLGTCEDVVPEKLTSPA
jgi:L-threonine kinase